MASVNKVILIGNLGADPELRFTPTGRKVANARLATTRHWKDRESGERREETEWHSLVFFDRLAEIVDEYLKRGRPIYVEGRLKTQKWEQGGEDRYRTVVIVETLQMLGGADHAERQVPAGEASELQGGAGDELDDDIPF